MKMPKPMDHCGQCSKTWSEDENVCTVSYSQWKYRGENSPLNGQLTFTTCDSLKCQLALHTFLAEDLKKRIAENKASAVGPTSRGAPGCAFNDPPDRIKKEEK